MMVGAFSPLCRIFMKQYQDMLIENPEKIFEQVNEPIKLQIYRAVGDYVIYLNRPKTEENPVLLEWLTGGDDGCLSPETDQYGVVKITSTPQETGNILALLDSNISKKQAEELRKTFASNVDNAKKLSRFRVMRAVETTYYNIKKQWEYNKEANFGQHTPSKSEYLCLKVMAEEFKHQNKKELDINKKMQELMQELPESFLAHPVSATTNVPFK